MGGWRRLPKRLLGAVSVGYKCHRSYVGGLALGRGSARSPPPPPVDVPGPVSINASFGVC